jgi:hypothetical protein
VTVAGLHPRARSPRSKPAAADVLRSLPPQPSLLIARGTLSAQRPPRSDSRARQQPARASTTPSCAVDPRAAGGTRAALPRRDAGTAGRCQALELPLGKGGGPRPAPAGRRWRPVPAGRRRAWVLPAEASHCFATRSGARDHRDSDPEHNSTILRPARVEFV